MSAPIEKVFIAWGGNQDVAKMVSNELNKQGFDGIVGGGTPTDLYIGTQVFSQIHQCTRAIILVENTRSDAINPFSSNLMFEWGYFTAKLDPRKLHLWFKYFCSCRLGLLFMFIVRDNEFDVEYKTAYFQKATECFDECLGILTEIAEKYPQEYVYVKLYEGYIYRDFFRLYRSIGDMEKTFQNISAATKAHEVFYLYYKQRYPNDGYLIKHFGKEYYLDCAKRLKFVKDPNEKKDCRKYNKVVLREIGE